MNLKEAFRFNNKLQSLIEKAQLILENEANVTEVKTTYYRHRVSPDLEDETIVTRDDSEFSGCGTELAGFALSLLGEKEKLFCAIRKAKAGLPIDLDSEVSLNASRQSLARTLKCMNDLRSSEQIIINGGTGYRFNVEGNQVSYRCDVKRVTTIDFDRKVIRRELTALHQRSDATSAQIDLNLVTAKVEYTPPFDVNDSFSDVFEAYREKSGT